MKCFNCGKTVPDFAVRCLNCEADLLSVAEFKGDDMAAVTEAMEAMEKAVPGSLDKLRDMALSFDNAEDFVNAIFVGACPACGSDDIGTFEGVKDIDDSSVARCCTCGQVWCAECFSEIKDPRLRCGHWAVCEKCPDAEDCDYIADVTDCPEVTGWLSEEASRKPDAQIYTLDVWLLEISPRKPFKKRGHTICRTIEILGVQSLADLHASIFRAFDREEEHLYEFRFGGKSPLDPQSRVYGMDEDMAGGFPFFGTDEDGDEDNFDSLFSREEGDGDTVFDTSIESLGLNPGDMFAYHFDFGDDWWHQIDVKSVSAVKVPGRYPRLTGSVGDSPPQYPDFDE